MKAIITIKGHDNRGNYKTISEEIQVPEFKPCVLEGSEERRLNNWLWINQPLVKSIINKHGLEISYRNQNQFQLHVRAKYAEDSYTQNIELIKTANEFETEEIRNSFIACYCRMKENLKGLPIERQINITLDALNIGMEARNQALIEQAKKMIE